MAILTNERVDTLLTDYYLKIYGKNDNDKWFEQPARNVWIFERDGKIITLKCHLITGVVIENIKEK